jgi:hypothetical protein
MEISPMLMDWQNQNSKNDYTTEINLHVYTIPIKISVTYIITIDKSYLKFIWKHKRPQIAKAILSKKSNVGVMPISDFKL